MIASQRRTSQAMDPYASRAVERCEITRRPDPALWGRDEIGFLSAEEMRSYEERGYLVCRQLLGSDEVAALVAEADRLRDEADPARDDVITEAGSSAIRSVFRVHHEAAFANLARDPRLASRARQLLGSEVYLHQSRINYKPGFDGRPFPWHSDFETWHMEDGMPRPRALSASILLTDNADHNGPLLVIPGSHLAYVRCFGEAPRDHHRSSLVNQQYGVPTRDILIELAQKSGIESATGPAGTVVFFDCNLMHGSGGNITPAPRNNVFYVYNSVDNALVAPFACRAPRPDFLAEREFEALPR